MTMKQANKSIIRYHRDMRKLIMRMGVGVELCNKKYLENVFKVISRSGDEMERIAKKHQMIQK